MLYLGNPKQMISNLQQAVAVERNESAYRKLFILFHRPLVSFAQKIVGTEVVAEEVYSDTMLKIWQMGDGLLGVQDLKLYLFKMTRNASLNYVKKQKNITFIDIADIWENIAYDESPEDLMIHNELRRHINEAIKSLPPKCQLVYRLIREDGFTYRYTAEILELSVNTVERHMANALHKLVNSLKTSDAFS